MNKQKKFWNWRNQADDADPKEPRILELYGTIASESWFDDDVTPQMFKDELFAGDGDVVIYLNSPGGDCIAASQIYTMLMDYRGNITVKIDGIAASAASVIAMAGTEVLMAPTSLMMIHNPMTAAFGSREEMESPDGFGNMDECETSHRARLCRRHDERGENLGRNACLRILRSGCGSSSRKQNHSKGPAGKVGAAWPLRR